MVVIVEEIAPEIEIFPNEIEAVVGDLSSVGGSCGTLKIHSLMKQKDGLVERTIAKLQAAQIFLKLLCSIFKTIFCNYLGFPVIRGLCC